MAYFPMFVNLEGREVLVVGGGAIAERRILALLGFGCRVLVVSPRLTEALLMKYENGEIDWLKKEYESKDIKSCLQPAGFAFVLTMTDDGEVNGQVALDCRRAKIPVNDASDKRRCDFYFPGLIREDGLVVGVSAGGNDHRKAAAVTRAIESFIRKTWQS